LNKNIKKIIVLVAIALLTNLVFAVVTFAKDSNIPAEQSTIGHLDLYQKDPGKWKIDSEDAWREMTYGFSDPIFTLSYTIGRVFLDINAMYQRDRDLKDLDYNYYNWGIGGQIGIFF